MKLIQVITSIDNEVKAEEIGRSLLGKRLAACVQIIPMNSMYWWKNKIEKSSEFMIVIKGKDFKKIKEDIEMLHTYKVPEIIQLNIKKSNKKYLEWLEKVC